MEILKILQLGKFYPVRGGVEKVMYDLMTGLSERGVDCDMLCALSQGGSRTIAINAHACLIGCRTWMKVAATMISPAMIFSLRKRCGEYDIIHVHHPDPMACLALFLSGYRGKVVLHWHADIEKQKMLLELYRPLQEWLLGRADLIVGTTPVYTAESPCLARVQHKTVCLPIGVAPVVSEPEKADALRRRYPGRKIVFSLGRLVAYKGYRYLIESARYLTDDYVVLIGGSGPLMCDLQADLGRGGQGEAVRQDSRRGSAGLLRGLRCLLPEQRAEDGGFRHCADRGHVVRQARGGHPHPPFGHLVGERARDVGAERGAGGCESTGGGRHGDSR